MIGIIDYGCGNLSSLAQALQRVGAEFSFVSDAAGLAGKTHLILPGVGHFGFASRELDRLALRDGIHEAVDRGVPLLGICLGMQLLFDLSDEAEDADRGLGLIAGRVRSLRSLGVTEKVPHVGWNSLAIRDTDCPTLCGIESGYDAYFVHAFAAEPLDQRVVTIATDYGPSLVAGVRSESVFGVQFHPEKSSAVGHLILRNFCNLVC